MFRARSRTWVRAHTPTVLYDRGLVMPKAANCGDHEWHAATEGVDACYHCRITRESRLALIEAMREFRKGNRLDGLTIRELIDEGRKY